MSFYMNMGILNEGEQAEAYKKRKEEEKLAKEKAEKDHHNKRYPGFRGDDSYLRKPAGSQNPSNKDRNLFFVNNHPEIYKKDSERSQKVDNILDKEESRRKKEYDKASDDYYNAKSENTDKKPLLFGRSGWNEKDKKIKEEKARKREDMYNKRDSYYGTKSLENMDAVNRHLRRHPSSWHENCGIFEDCEIFK